MKTEQEIRDAIATGTRIPLLTHYTLNSMGEWVEIDSIKTAIRTEEVQELAIIIGKALGVVE